ncbi:MAG: DUF4278 domain-containing protein [Cyanobacteria bacterium P01_F01_bin.4]
MTQTQASNTTVELCYRGVKYHARTHIVKTVTTAVVGRFRGQVYCLRQIDETDEDLLDDEICYRGWQW